MSEFLTMVEVRTISRSLKKVFIEENPCESPVLMLGRIVRIS